MGFHAAHGTAGAAEQLRVAVVQVVQIAPQFLAGGRRTAAGPPQQGRVCDEAPPDHDAGQLRELCFQCVQLLRGGHVAVVAHRHGAPGQRFGKGGPVGLAAVQLPHHAGVDGQFTDGVTVIDVQNGGKLVRAADAQPGLDRNRPFRMGEYRIQKGVQHGGVPQHAGAFALGGHGAGGAAEVQVHFGVTQGTQLTDHPGSQLAVLGQQLRDHRRTGVCGGGKLRHLLFDEHPVLRRGEEGCVVAVGGAFRPEPLLLGLTPDPVGKPLHGGGIILHKKTPGFGSVRIS